MSERGVQKGDLPQLQATCKSVLRTTSNSQDHIPKRCEEVEADLKLSSRHAIEEAMSEALVRKCPHCSKPYIKLDGCNKMTCSACGKMSCFVCRKPIANYEHFEGQGARRPTGTKCPLYDVNEARVEAERIRLARDEAQRRAIAEASTNGVAVDEADLAVDAPEIPAARRGAPVHQHYHQPAMLVAGLGNRLEALNRMMIDVNGAMGVAGAHRANQEALRRNVEAANELRRQLLNMPALAARPPAPPQGGRGRRGAQAPPPAPAPVPAPVGGRGRRAHVHGAAQLPPFPVARPPTPPPAPIRGHIHPDDFVARLEAFRRDFRQNGAGRYHLGHQPPPYQ